jgi:hypothetical protein
VGANRGAQVTIGRLKGRPYFFKWGEKSCFLHRYLSCASHKNRQADHRVRCTIAAMRSALFLFFAASVLVGCGGDGGSSSSANIPVNPVGPSVGPTLGGVTVTDTGSLQNSSSTTISTATLAYTTTGAISLTSPYANGIDFEGTSTHSGSNYTFSGTITVGTKAYPCHGTMTAVSTTEYQGSFSWSVSGVTAGPYLFDVTSST